MKNLSIIGLFLLCCFLLVGCSRTSKEQTIFVYGSLREGFHNYTKYLSGKVVSTAPGIVKGKLYHIEDRGYPALLEGDDDIYGEIMVVSDKYPNILAELDELEEFFGKNNINNEYDRKTVTVLNAKSGKKQKLPVYFFNMNNPDVDTSQLIPIESGDWKEYMRNNPHMKK